MGKKKRKDKLKVKPKEQYIMLLNANLDWGWEDEELQLIKEKWQEGYHINDIAKAVDRPILEVGLLLIDLDLQEKIESREGGVFGWLA